MEIVKNPNFQKMLNEILKLYERSKLRYSFFLLDYFYAGHHRAPPPVPPTGSTCVQIFKQIAKLARIK